MSKDDWKCNGEKFCDSLHERLQGWNKKGLVLLTFSSLKSGYPATLSYVGYKTSASDQGRILNYCPWCGYVFPDKGMILE